MRFDAIRLCSFLVAEHARCNNNHEGNSDTADKRRPRRTGKAGNQISKQADDGNQGSASQEIERGVDDIGDGIERGVDDIGDDLTDSNKTDGSGINNNNRADNVDNGTKNTTN